MGRFGRQHTPEAPEGCIRRADGRAGQLGACRGHPEGWCRDADLQHRLRDGQEILERDAGLAGRVVGPETVRRKIEPCRTAPLAGQGLQVRPQQGAGRDRCVLNFQACGFQC